MNKLIKLKTKIGWY